MPRTAAKITKTEVQRIIKAAIDSGFRPGRVEVEGGKIVLFGTDALTNADASPLDEWRRKNGAD